MHTAGPWEAPRNGLDGAIYAPNAPKGTLWRICDAVRGLSDEELSANARLIAAAPELLAAARVLAEGWFQREHPDSPGVTITDSQMAEAAYDVRAAVAKVEGEE